MTRPLFERIFNENNSVGGFLVDMNLNVINNKRSIYNALDCLGDVGGLFDMLLFLITSVVIPMSYMQPFRVIPCQSA